MRLLLPLLLLVGACKKDRDPIVWFGGASYEWALANHRLSHLEVGANAKGAYASVVGGTSTTGIDAELPQACDPDTCEELPFWDEALVRVDWGRVDEPDARSAVVRAELTADADGETVTVDATIDKSDGELVTATIQGIRFSTDHPLDGDAACYNPEFGWLPTQLGIALSEPSSSGDDISVDVTASFAAGNTLEAIRECIDAVIDRARVAIEVDVLIVAGGSAIDSTTVDGTATFEYGDGPLNPTPQEMPEPQAISLDLEDPILGWSQLDWSFHVADPDGRGAYLRRLDWSSSPDEARGAATNYSQLTQLSGFDYVFSGVVVGHDVGGTITRGSVETTIPVEIEGDEPVLHEIGKTR